MLPGTNVDNGNVTAQGGCDGAGIGGGDDGDGGSITICAGTVNATGGKWAAGIGGGQSKAGGDIKIHGGTVIATGGEHGAAIGGGENGSGGAIDIRNANLTATAGIDSAAIGGGDGGDGGTIKMYKSTINATGGSVNYDGGAAIGGGDEKPGGIIEITDCEVTAKGGCDAAAIGGGDAGAGGTITLTGGTINATGGEYGAAIGGGQGGSGGTITINSGTVTATGGQYGAGIGGGENGSGGTIRIKDGDVTATGGEYGAGIGSGYCQSGEYTNGGDIEISGGKVKANGTGYHADHADFGDTYNGSAGIGGGYLSGGGKIKITGGEVEANAGYQAAAIGGGNEGSFTSIEITGGTVKATAASYYPPLTSISSGTGAAIGDGRDVDSTNKDIDRTITISGGTVIATTSGSNSGAAIGAGYDGYSTKLSINITGCDKIEASGGVGAGIGGATDSDVKAINISGNVDITATSGNSAGIGGGNYADVESITISDITGSITATASSKSVGAGIGGGSSGKVGKITISAANGTITAKGGLGAAGIGTGRGCEDEDGAEQKTVDITINGGTIYAEGGESYSSSDFSYKAGAGIGAGGSTIEYGKYKDKSSFNGEINLNGGVITVKNRELSTAIGSTDPTIVTEGSGTVNFNGATVKMISNDQKPVVGAKTINIKDTDTLRHRVSCKEREEDALIPVAMADRIATLQANEKKIVVVEICQHEEIVYTDNGGDHTGVCPVCEYSVTSAHSYPEAEPVWSWAEDHLTATATFTCEICGHEHVLNADVVKNEYFTKNIYVATVEFEEKTYTTDFEEFSKPAFVSYMKATYKPSPIYEPYGYVLTSVERVEDYEIVAADENNWSDGAYVLLFDTTISEKISVNGNVNLILCDGVTLRAEKGITVADGGHLNIYARQEGTGKLIALGENGAYHKANPNAYTAIEGSVTVHGGVIEATGGAGGEGAGTRRTQNGDPGGKGGSGFSGDIIIYNGTIKAVGNNGGRGGYGYKYSGSGGDGGSGLSGEIEIYGGSLELSGGAGGKGDNTDYNTGIYSADGKAGAAITATSAKIWGQPTFVTAPFTEVRYKAPTIESDGNIYHYNATNGDHYFREDYVYTPADRDVVLPKIVLTHVPAADAACIEDGNTEYWYSEHYDTYYADDRAEQEIAKGSFVIPATGHSYGAPTWSWLNDYSTATAHSECANCHEVFDFEADVTSEKAGIQTVYTATAEIDGTTYTDIEKVNLPREYFAAVEPKIDEDGAYIIGTKEHYVIDGRKYAVNEDQSVGGELSELALSYFDFALIRNGSEYQIKHYIGPKANLSEIVIPKTYNGKPVTVLGDGDKSPFIHYEENDPEKTQFTLVLNENISMILQNAFYAMWVTKVEGDTSGLSVLGANAFSWANSPDDYALDIKLDYPGQIMGGTGIFQNLNVTVRVRHATSFSDGEKSLGARSVTYIVTDDQHTYGDPVWSWSDDCTAATATFTCTDTRCRHEETVDATIERTAFDSDTGMGTFTATAKFGGNSYTDTKTGYADHLGTRLIGCSLSLDGDIGVNFYMELSEAVAKSNTAYMHFTTPKNGEPDTQDIKVSDARIVESGGNTYHVFKCQVAAKEMNSEIRAQILDGDKQGTVFTYTVKEYADYLLEHAGEREDLAKAAPLVKDMLNYGAYAQIYFDKTSMVLANEKLTDEEKALGEVAIDIAAPAIGALPSGTTFAGATLSLKSETTLSLYFKSNETLSFSCGKYTVETAERGSYQIARIRGVKVKKLGNIFTLKLNGATVRYSPLNYCKNVLRDSAADEKLKNVIKALYLYYKAADEYFVDAHTHTGGEAVRENEIPATCTAAGSYDETVYCTECGEEISRETKMIAMLAHTPGEAVREKEVPATCTVAGSYDEVVYCTECHVELSREAKTIEQLAHTPAKAIRENEVPATCLAAGSYDEVVYCTACHGELSREAKTIDKLAHAITAVAEVLATGTENGMLAHFKCSMCEKLFFDEAGITETTIEALTIPKRNTVDLSQLTGDYEAQNGDVLTGKLSGNKKITVAADAVITLSNADITSLGEGAEYAGITPLGNATILLEGENTVKGGAKGYQNEETYEVWGEYPGILAPSGYTLTFAGEGSLTASCNDAVATENRSASGIGGGDMLNSGNIVINGGVITATGGGFNAGIGCGSEAQCGDITINGGTVNATGGDEAAGIGSGGDNSSCGAITINGGTVNATGGDEAAGIGSGGYYSSCDAITINGGSVTAVGGNNGAGVGCGFYATCGKITINGGSVTASGRGEGAAIGGGSRSTCGDITIADTVTKVIATKGADASNTIGAGKNGTCGTVTVGGKEGAITESPFEYPLAIIDLGELTGDCEAPSGVILTGTLSGNHKITIAPGATVTLKDVNITSLGAGAEYAGITPLGDATILLEGENIVKGGTAKIMGNDGYFGIYPGILAPENYTLTIAGDGSLTASGNTSARAAFSCGIGGGYLINSGNIVINSGTITAIGGQMAAGIGCGTGEDEEPVTGGDITINGGTVTAAGGLEAAGIGSASGSVCGEITITGGIVNADGGVDGAGVGSGGYNSSCGAITINGGSVTAVGGVDGAGVGSGVDSFCAGVTITGGTVNAVGGEEAAGIGSGSYDASCGAVTITDTVTKVIATKGKDSPNSIGAGLEGTCGTVTVGGVEGAITESPYTYEPN